MSSYVVSGDDGKPITLYVHPPIVKVTFQRRGKKILACGEIETYGVPIRLCASTDLDKGKALAVRLVKACAAKLAVAEKQGPAVAAGAVPDVPLLTRESLQSLARNVNAVAAQLTKMSLLHKIEEAAKPLAKPDMAKAYGLPVVVLPGAVPERLLRAGAILHQRAMAKDKRAVAIVKALAGSQDPKAKAILAIIRKIHRASAPTRASLPLAMGIGDSDGYSNNQYVFGEYYDHASGSYVMSGVAYDPDTGHMYAEGAYPEEALVGFGDLIGAVPIRQSAARMASPRVAPPKRPPVPVRPGMRPPISVKPRPGVRPPIPVKPRPGVQARASTPLGAAMRAVLTRLFGAQRVARVRLP